MYERQQLTEQRMAELDRRIEQNFRWLFPDYFENTPNLTPLGFVEIIRSAKALSKEAQGREISQQEALWDCFQLSTGRDGAQYVRIGTALMWGERYGSGDFNPQEDFRQLASTR